MLDLHLTEDCGSIVRHGNFAVGGNEDFIQPYMVGILESSVDVSMEI